MDPTQSENPCMYTNLYAREQGDPMVTREKRETDGSLRQGQGRNPEMHDHGKSDSPIVPAKPSNKAGQPAAERVEGRGLAKGNTEGKTRAGHRAGTGGSSALDGVRRIAATEKDAKFTALMHHISIDRLRAAYRALNPKATTGVDKMTWIQYSQELEGNLLDLHRRVQSGAYRAKPTRRTYIPKADGSLRPLGVTTLEDKILQRATVEVL